ncbi:ATP-binding protein [Xylella fastidiosa subsp. pauca]|uniref:ATP-binding protein n=1 Tax=Xylella fastidiosa TaxID=2371 RepID=UPI000582F8D5|nr:ATP-binding protein [Xylella fastidiosa]ARO68680.1 ATP-binding protein [Xylella fastidiosa subsp. pauca]AVI20769.1 hypothetical protein BCV75_05825 [Xylella fastidiosa]AVI22797.1 hypothetical protein BC375_05890 [Xylella fastidiosa]KIA57924.1 hypothetical protein RA12_07795 [Xylella fastidiosa]KXB10418.1 hypothetical protein ADT32_09185 [Xylella fastidiosa]
MRTDLRGLVERIDLSVSRGLIPLFEAISNSIDAINERGIPPYDGCIRIRLIQRHDLATDGRDQIIMFDGFEISDNGIGFTQRNTKSFGEAYTLSKIKLGGKGVGRFMYLKVFQHVQIKSIFDSDGKRYQRAFRFSIDDEMVGSDKTALTDDPVGTTIFMQGVNQKYQSIWACGPETIVQRITEHFLIRFASGFCPQIILEATGFEAINVNDYHDQTVLKHIKELSFPVGENSFDVQVLRNKAPRAKHEYYLCANGREVTTARLRNIMPELPEKLTDDQQDSYTLIVLVTGKYLDEHTNQERTNILFEADDAPDLDRSLLSKDLLTKALAELLHDVLKGDLKTTNVEKILQIERFIEGAPEYRMLMHERYRHLIEKKIQPGLSDEKLDEALLHLRRDIEDSVRKEERHLAARMEKESFEAYEQQMKKLMEDINDVGKSNLAAYIAHRRIIIDLFGRSLKRAHEDDKYPLERILHKMIFPMGATSKDIFLDQQNLWMIDERLSFHTLLTSDKKLNSVRGLEGTSGKEPDIFAFFYDTPIGVAEPGDSAVVVIEFKRPGRNDYSSDPTGQITRLLNEIRAGTVNDIEGRPINSASMRYIGYLIADITPTMRSHIEMTYNKAADGQSYFITLSGAQGYVEIISYDRLLKDAKRRNRKMFEKLGVRKN